VKPAWSNIVVQRTVNDHTSYMIRVRIKCKMDEEISEHWVYQQARETLKLLHSTQTLGITRDGQSYHHLLPTPQSGGIVISEGFCAPEHHARVQRNYIYPPGTLTLWIEKHRTWANPKER
jgi:hypothetical protein